MSKEDESKLLAEFLEGIAVTCDNEFELEALQEAIRQERQRGSLKPAYVPLEEIRSRAARKH